MVQFLAYWIEGTQGDVEKMPSRELARNIATEDNTPSVYWAEHYEKNRREPGTVGIQGSYQKTWCGKTSVN